jgi:hypothetical protein
LQHNPLDQPSDGARLYFVDAGGASIAAACRGKGIRGWLAGTGAVFGACLFDSYRQGRGTSNLIQAQRDFFGAHGFERVDDKGAFHEPWGSGAAG